MNTPINQQERLAATLGSILFFLPHLMGKQTEYTMFFSRQGFALFLIEIIVWILGLLFPFLGVIIALANLILFLTMVFLAWKAWEGEKFAIPVLYDASLMVIKNLSLENFFSPKN